MPKDSRRLNGIDHLLGEALESESVVLACATADASSAVFLRLCRYPGAATTWLWARVITPDINCHLNDNYLPCSDVPLKLEAAAVEYSTEDREILTLWREGDRARPSRACRDRGRGEALLIRRPRPVSRTAADRRAIRNAFHVPLVMGREAFRRGAIHRRRERWLYLPRWPPGAGHQFRGLSSRSRALHSDGARRRGRVRYRRAPRACLSRADLRPLLARKLRHD
jgi:hypothetical protein